MRVSTIRKNDTVMAIAGVNKGRTGKALQIQPSSGRAIVEGLGLVKKALRKTQDNPQGGIVEKEAPIAISNLLLYCPSCKKGVRVSRGREGRERARLCRTCGHSFDG